VAGSSSPKKPPVSAHEAHEQCANPRWQQTFRDHGVYAIVVSKMSWQDYANVD
jgi:hypothetical protein